MTTRRKFYIAGMALSSRTAAAIWAHGIGVSHHGSWSAPSGESDQEILERISKKTAAEWMKTPNFGKVCLEELQAALPDDYKIPDAPEPIDITVDFDGLFRTLDELRSLVMSLIVAHGDKAFIEFGARGKGHLKVTVQK